MKPLLRWFALCLAVSLAGAAFGQQGPVPHSGPGPGPGLLRGFFQFMGAGVDWAKTVTGAPMSAQAVTEIKRTLADGNVIDRKETALIYRDGDGRVRIDRTLNMIGPWIPSGSPPEIVTIHDPVAGVTYILNPSKKTAYEIPIRRRGSRFYQGRPADASARSQATTQSLGVKTVNGVQAQGTETTRVIPAQQIGNAQPITITAERWYSPDLQMNVMTVRNDPRFGLTTYQLTRIQTSEPQASLFQVPSNYTIAQGRPRGPHRGVNPGAP